MHSGGGSALILAGGKSSRMGRAKAALPFGGVTILERILAELGKGFEKIVVIAARADSESYPVERMISGASGVVLLRDEDSYAGPVAALVRGLEAASGDTVFACSCDLPLLRVEVARFLCDRIDGFDAAIPRVDGSAQPLCAAYRRSSREAIEVIAAGGERRLTAIVSRLNARTVTEAELRPLEPDLRSFLNTNTPEDYARALALAGK
jgi:molybdopterin-guanine dinucleotide biosynthesis protein A